MADKSLNEIRSTFLKYFEKNDHKIVESSNLVPNNDPTLMFANSGMVQFKKRFYWLREKGLCDEQPLLKNVLGLVVNIMI
jgi:alanyl-tRNA synthetase